MKTLLKIMSGILATILVAIVYCFFRDNKTLVVKNDYEFFASDDRNCEGAVIATIKRGARVRIRQQTRLFPRRGGNEIWASGIRIGPFPVLFDAAWYTKIDDTYYQIFESSTSRAYNKPIKQYAEKPLGIKVGNLMPT